MITYTIISAAHIPDILGALDTVQQSLQNIEDHACNDFQSTKSILDVLTDLDIEHVLSGPARSKLSAIISNLQYVDVLQQRLSHISRTNEVIREELVQFTERPESSMMAYRYMIQLNLNQFQDAINLYLHTTDAVHNALTDISKNHKMLFLHIPQARLLYKYNSEILHETTLVNEVHSRELLRYRHPSKLPEKDSVDELKKIAAYYTMEQERVVFDAFLRSEMNYEQGYDVDSDKERISLF
ncbi:MAG: hypothetical protein AAFX87_25885 [Bacteroidota bacterium]